MGRLNSLTIILLIAWFGYSAYANHPHLIFNPSSLYVNDVARFTGYAYGGFPFGCWKFVFTAGVKGLSIQPNALLLFSNALVCILATLSVPRAFQVKRLSISVLLAWTACVAIVIAAGGMLSVRAPFHVFYFRLALFLSPLVFAIVRSFLRDYTQDSLKTRPS